MDSVFGIGAPELVVILILAGIVMGPHRIRQVALWLGKTTAALQSISRSFVRQLNAELAAVDGSGDLRETMSEVKELRKQITDLRREITSGAMAPIQESQKMLRDSKDMVERSIAPPSLKTSNSESADGESETSAATEPASPGKQEATSEPATPVELPNLVEVPDDPE
jgi:Sec-independent protein translocase protein TatA